MPNLPISQLPFISGSTLGYLGPNAEFAVAQDGVTYKVRNAQIAPGLFSQTGNSAVVSGTTVESTLIDGGIGSLSVPANAFRVGDSFRAVFGGVLNVANNQTITMRVKTGAVTLLDSGPQSISNVTGDIWSLDINFTVRAVGGPGIASIVSLGGFHYSKTSNGSVEGFAFNYTNNTTFDTTIDNTLDVTVQWGSGDNGNSIYSDIFVLNKIY